MLRIIRKIPFLNKVVRTAFRQVQRLAVSLNSNIIPRWRLSGEIPLRINDHEFRMWTRCDDLIVDSIYYGWNDEEAEMQIFPEFVKRSKTILDVGANTGIYSIIAATVNPNASVYAFEPYPPNYIRLQKNLHINRASNVKVIPTAVGDQKKKISFTVPVADQISTVNSVSGDFTKQFHPEISYKEVEVDCITLDDFCTGNQVAEISLIKIDVETFEAEVLEGARKLLKDQSPVIFCEITITDKAIQYFESALAELGYYKYVVLKEGIFYTEAIAQYPTRTFILTKKRAQHRFYPVRQANVFAEEVMNMFFMPTINKNPPL
jgi:FkbM family methyltransferase